MKNKKDLFKPKNRVITTVTTKKVKLSLFAYALRNARIDAGYTQRQVADHMGFRTVNNIKNWECDYHEPNLPALIKLCVLYSISPNDLLWIE